MSLLQGTFKKQLRQAMNPKTWDTESCPGPQNLPDFHDKTYTEDTFKPSPDFLKRIEDDERKDFLLRIRHNMNEYFDNSAYANPHGMTTYDYKSIAMCRRDCLEDYKMKTRRENYQYMRDHPEIDSMIQVLLRKTLIVLPADPVKFAAEYFCMKHSSYDDHRQEIENERERIKLHRKSKSKEFYTPKEIPAPSSTMRKLNLGPLSGLLHFTKTPETPLPEPEPKIEVKETPPVVYCGCKDWKKNRNKNKLNEHVPSSEPATAPAEDNMRQENSVDQKPSPVPEPVPVATPVRPEAQAPLHSSISTKSKVGSKIISPNASNIKHVSTTPVPSKTSSDTRNTSKADLELPAETTEPGAPVQGVKRLSRVKYIK